MPSGNYGSFTWQFENGTLTISGVGGIYNTDPLGVGSLFSFSFLKFSVIPWRPFMDEIKKLIVNEGIREIGTHAFENCRNLKEVILPNSVTKIGDWAFSLCFSLEIINIPDSVTEIGYLAFCGCKSLTEIKIPQGVTKIGSTVIMGVKFEEKIFCDCNSLKKVYYPAGSSVYFMNTISYGHHAQLIPYTVEQLRWNIEGKTLTVGGVREIKNYSQEKPPWIDSIGDIQQIVIEEGVEEISANAFAACHRLEHLIIPVSVRTIGDFAFTLCYCGEQTVNGGKNVIWSLDDGVLMLKKNPAVQSDADFSTGYEMWNVADKNIKGVKIERGVIPSKQFFDWLAKMGGNVSVQIS